MPHLHPQGLLALWTLYLALVLVFWCAGYRKMQVCSERHLQTNGPGHAPLLAS
jgi:hypothetical protein